MWVATIFLLIGGLYFGPHIRTSYQVGEVLTVTGIPGKDMGQRIILAEIDGSEVKLQTRDPLLTAMTGSTACFGVHRNVILRLTRHSLASEFLCQR